MTSYAERRASMIPKCDAALKTLTAACGACESLLKHDLHRIPHEPERCYDQEHASELIFEATGDFAAAAKKLRTARALLAYANRPQ